MNIEPAADSLPRISTPDGAGDEAVDELTALLPFIEALGMTQTATPIPVEARPESSSDNVAMLADAPPAVSAVALPAFLPASTANSAGNPAATASVTIPTVSSDTAATIANLAAVPASSLSGTTTNAPVPAPAPATPATAGIEPAVSQAAPFTNAFPGPVITPTQEVSSSMADVPSLPAGPVAPAISAANSTPQAAVILPAQLPAAEADLAPTPTAAPGMGATAAALSAGREFASQLVATITASKEAQHSPGTTADAVHNVIAQAVPGRANVQEAAPVISQAVGAPGWSEEIGNRVAWMAGHSESRAELVLNPPQMGRVEVNLTLKGDLATASFASSNPVVREALEAALPRLREVLADAGIQLGQTQVSAENARQWTQQEKNGDNSGSDLGRRNAADPAISRISSGSLPTTAALKTGRGFVDVFA